MADHNHYEVMRRSSAALPLGLVGLLEIFASLSNGRLAINAQLFDVFSDLLAFGLVGFGAWFSGFLDDRGREHQPIHGEQLGISLVNLLLLAVGATFVLVRATLSFWQRPTTISWADDWWVIVGPALSIFIYWWMREKVRQASKYDLTLASMEAHIRADLYVALVVTILTILSLAVRVRWMSPVGGLIVSAIFFYICADLLKEIRSESRET